MTLLYELESAGFALGVDGDRLTVTPASRLTPALRKLIGERKAELLAAVRGKGPPPPPALREGAKTRSPMRPYLPTPFDPATHRRNLESFWAETGWRPVGGWQPSERTGEHGSDGSAPPAAVGGGSSSPAMTTSAPGGC